MHDKKIIVVDDEQPNRILMEDILEEYYEVSCFSSGHELFDYLENGGSADLIILDIMMPGMNGYQVCENLKNNRQWKDIPVLFVTGLSSDEEEEKGLAIGAEDFIHKPYSISIVIARVKTHLKLAEARQFLRDKNAYLENEVRLRTNEIVKKSYELERSQTATIKAFCTLAEKRDNETGNHILRTQGYVRVLAETLKDHPRFVDYFEEDTISLLYRSAPLHDIGKVAIPDSILLKPGKLDPDEWEIMKTHSRHGYDAIVEAEREMGETGNEYLRYAKEIAHYHHEHWDGTGYPEGLKGDEIPFSARLMAVADVYDALRTKRVYKDAFPHEEAIENLKAGRGVHFDPDIIDAMLKVESKFLEISEQYKD